MERNCLNQIGAVFDFLEKDMGLLSSDDVHKHLRTVKTGFHDLDHQITGLHRRGLTVLASRPGMGKSALASQIAMHAAIDCHLATLIFSMELSIYHQAIRLICQRGKIDASRLQCGRLDTDEMRRLSETQDVIRKAPLFIDDSPAMTMKRIHGRVEEFHFENCYGTDKPFGLVVVDGLMDMAPIYEPDAPNKAWDKVMSGLRELANEFDVPVVVLSNLSRKLEERKDRRPRPSDLPSPPILSYADQIMLLYREDYYQPDTTEKGIAELHVFRNRYGHCGGIRLNFIHEYLRYEDWPSPTIANEEAQQGATE